MPRDNGSGLPLDSSVQQGLRVHKDRPVSRAHRERLALTVPQVPTVRGDLLAQKAHKGREDNKVLMAPLGHRVQGVQTG